MEKKNKEAGSNPFVEGFFKNVGRDITVVVSTPEGLSRITGRCEAVELQQKGVIIRDDKKTFFIKNYLWIERNRKVV